MYSLFSYITWGLVIIILLLLAKRIGRGVFGVMVFVGALFFSIFMLDTFTTVNVRNYLPIGFYDKTIEDPKGTAEKVGNSLKGAGEKAVDKVNDVGDNADKYFAVEKSKETGDKTWVKGDELVEKDGMSVDKQDIEEGKKGSKKDKKDKTALVSGHKDFVKYTDVKSLLQTKYSKLPHGDIEIIKSFSPILQTKIEGEKVVVYNNTDKYEDGLYIVIK